MHPKTTSLAAVLLLLAACAGGAGTSDTQDTDEGPDSACGETTRFDIVISGLVEDADGNPVEGATVVLDDQGYDHEEKGEAVTDSAGTFSISATDLASVEDCWGTLLDYVLEADTTDGLSGEKSVNSYLLNAIEDGSYEADISAFPLVVE